MPPGCPLEFPPASLHHARGLALMYDSVFQNGDDGFKQNMTRSADTLGSPLVDSSVGGRRGNGKVRSLISGTVYCIMERMAPNRI